MMKNVKNFDYYKNNYPTISPKERYDKYVEDYKNDPLHWSNNKRKNHGLPVLRGKLNKKRKNKKDFYNYSYFFLEDIISEELNKKFKNWFDSLVNIKDVQDGDKNIYTVNY